MIDGTQRSNDNKTPRRSHAKPTLTVFEAEHTYSWMSYLEKQCEDEKKAPQRPRHGGLSVGF